jgi:CubicO group peptidase (beta-lactamase class C family)
LALPSQPEGVHWPTREWPQSQPAPKVDRDRLRSALDQVFAAPQPADTSATNAVVVVHRGAIVAERYAEGFGPDDTQPSWSMAKGVLHALVGILVRDGKLDIHAPAGVPEWSEAEDPRRGITLDQLLRMSSGLHFTEDYVDGESSDVIEMLFGSGRADTGAFAAELPLAHEPDTVWSYSSGTSNIVSRIAGDVVGRGEEYLEFMRRELLEPLGMTSAIPKFDHAGNFIGSSFLFCTPRDFARFGFLYLRDGVWNGRRILPQGWVDYARTATPAADRGEYGAHFWLG